jgi:hypothetical protein
MASRMLPSRQKMLNRSDERLSPHLSIRLYTTCSKRKRERKREKENTA